MGSFTDNARPVEARWRPSYEGCLPKRLSVVIDLLLKGSAFDVCQDLQLGNVFFLYEIYTDEDALKNIPPPVTLRNLTSLLESG